jgi:hypothetical protein
MSLETYQKKDKLEVMLMSGEESKLYDALAKISEAASVALNECSGEHEHEGGGDSGEPLCCIPKSLPDRLQVKAAAVAAKINPVNSPLLTAFGRMVAEFQVLEPQRIAVLTSKYWGAKPRRLTVSFMETTPADLRARIISHMNAWTKTGGGLLRRDIRDWPGSYLQGGRRLLLLPRDGHPAYSKEPSDYEPARFHDEHTGVRVQACYSP